MLNLQNNTATGTTAGGVTVASGAALELQGGIAVGAEALSVNGTGVGGNGALRNVSGNNSWGGTVTLAGAAEIQSDAGTLTLNAANAVTGANRNLTFDGAGNGVIGGTITTGTGTLTKNGTGTLTLSGANTYTGATTVSAGSLALTNGVAIADAGVVNLSASGADLTLNTSETIGSLAGVAGTTVTLGGNTLTAGGNNGTTTYAGVIGGSGGLTKQGTGTLTLSGANTHTGTTTVSAGTLALGANDVLADGSSVVVNGGTLSMTTRSDTVAGVQLVSGSITGTTGVLTATSAYDMQSGTVSAILGGGTGLNKTTAGTLILSGNNTYTGPTAINAGVLQLGAANRIADASAVTVAAGATFNLNNFAETVGSLAGAGNVTLGSASLITGGDNTSTIFSGAISGTGALTKTGAGTLTLSGTNSYTGTTTINAGTLALGVSNALASGPVTVSGGTWDLETFSDTVGAVTLISGSITGSTGILTGTSYAVQSGTVSAILAGTGALTKTTAGTVVLSGANSYTGATTVSAGVLNLQNNTATGTTAGGVTVASGAALELQGGIAVGAEALSVNGTGVGGNGALRNVSGNNSWGGTVTLAGAAEIQSDAGTLTLNAANAVTGANRNLTFDGAGNGVIGGTITTGTGTLTKNGTGTLTLSGANTYTGATTVSAGSLALTNGVAIADAGVVNLSASGADLTLNTSETIGSLAGVAGTTVTLGGNTLTAGGNNGTTTYAGVIGGSGGLTKQGTGTLTLSGANTHTGTTTVSAGTLALGANDVLADGSSVAVNGYGPTCRHLPPRSNRAPDVVRPSAGSRTHRRPCGVGVRATYFLPYLASSARRCHRSPHVGGRAFLRQPSACSHPASRSSPQPPRAMQSSRSVLSVRSAPEALEFTTASAMATPFVSPSDPALAVVARCRCSRRSGRCRSSSACPFPW